jgi:thiol-disulfide isomerase/thioredoxin
MLSIRRTAAVAAATLLLASCAPATPGDADPATGGSADPTTSTSAEPTGPFAFNAQTLEGGMLDGESLKGQDVILWFWAPWCPTCLVEGKNHVAPFLAELPDDVAFVGIAGRSDSIPEMEEFLDWTGTGTDNAVHVADVDGSIWEGFGVALQPAFYFVNQDGTARRAGSGLTEEDLMAEVEILQSK